MATGLPTGLALNGSVISGTATVTGTFNVALDASNANGADNRTLVVSIIDPSTGDGYSAIDSDGDGVPDVLELLLGTSPTNPASTPNIDMSNVQPITNAKVSIALNAMKATSDTIMIGGVVPLAPSQTLKGTKVGLLVGDVPRNFTLDAKGNGKTATGDTFKLTLPKPAKGKVVATVNATFTAKIVGSDMVADLIDENITTAATVKNAPRSLIAWLVVNQAVFKTKKSVMLTATKGVSASAK
jgi:hypothetical protein